MLTIKYWISELLGQISWEMHTMGVTLYPFTEKSSSDKMYSVGSNPLIYNNIILYLSIIDQRSNHREAQMKHNQNNVLPPAEKKQLKPA